MSRHEDFTRFRQKMNTRILETGNLGIRRFFALDESVYRDGTLDRGTKEMLGLATSMVLRCDDCISYHLVQCRKAGVSLDALMEVFSVALVVGGSIVIPHLRRAVDFLDELENEASDG